MIALFDADILVFRAGFAAERNQWYLAYDRDDTNPDASPKEFDGFKEVETFAYKREAEARLDEILPGKYSREEGVDYQLWAEKYLEPLENALHNVKVMVDKALNDLDCTEFDAKMYLSGGHNFRYDVAKTRPYKGNRDKKHRPTHEEEIRKYIRRTWDTEVTDGIEADDALGIAQCQTYGPQDSVIVTIDKDLDMIPGLKYNFVNEIYYDVPHYEAWKNFCIQLLTGDTTDNIPGLPKVGPAKAEKYLDGIGYHEDGTPCERADLLLEEVVRQYAARSMRQDWFDYLKEQAALIWIMRKPGETGDTLIPDEWRDIAGEAEEGEIDAVLF